MSNKKKIILTGGGTGGHIYPNIAIAQCFLEHYNDVDLFYMGCSGSMEQKAAITNNIEFIQTKVSGMPRGKSIYKLLGVVKWSLEIFASTIKSVKLFRKLKPSVIFSTGGYVAAPAVIAAIFLQIPFVLHDSDAKPGIVTRAFAPFASAVNISFEGAKKFLKSSKITTLGNPVRDFNSGISREEALKTFDLTPEKHTLLVMGGSQGAKAINEALLGVIEELIKQESVQIIHQTGAKNYDEFIEKLEEKQIKYNQNGYIVRPFFDDISIPYKCADIVVARSGSISLSELNINGLPAILVPYPYAAADHQRHNALAMQKEGASIMLEDKNLTAEALLSKVKKLLNDKNTLKLMKEANLRIAKPDSTKDIAELIIHLARN